ncbi:MAG: NADH-quinone oxidoreductase subunit A [Chthoniobacteraceae bacterium]|nr:NADH-quinone oxidoreductase subunit A [Chthoniobacteraceae bacterium]
MSHDYLLLTLFLAIAVIFPVIPLALAWFWARLFSPAKPGHDKQAIYECGLESKGPARIQFRAQYYLYALVFLVFDVETVFLLPFAAMGFVNISVTSFLAILVFLFLLLEGLVWAWAKGILEWK